MKTRTYKALLIVVILLQLASAAIAVVGMQARQNDEKTALLQLTANLLKFHATLGDYQLEVAAGNPIENMQVYETVRLAINNDLDRLVKINQGRPDRIAVYMNQKENFAATDGVLSTLKEATNKRDSSRWTMLIVLLSGMRKLEKVAHSMYDDIGKMIETVPKDEGGGALPIASIVCSVLSIGILGAIMFKGPTSSTF